MSREAYRYTLYRTKRWWPHDTDPVVEGEQVWLNLQDEGATLAQVTDLIVRKCGARADISQYTVEVTDLHTGEVVSTLSPDDLAAGRAGRASLPPADSGSLAGVSDEALVRELLRRLTRR